MSPEKGPGTMETGDINPQNYDERLNNLRKQREVSKIFYQSTLNELIYMSKGDELDGARDEYYPGWKDNDFKKLLKDLGEKV